MSNELKVLAQLMLNEEMDYSPEASLPSGQLLGNFGGEAWVVDSNSTCVMEEMPKLYRVL